VSGWGIERIIRGKITSFSRPALALDMMDSSPPLVAYSTIITAINNGEVKVEDFVSTATGCN
jgi:CRISPR/Cas system-associated endonuclease Cas1